MRVRNTRRAIEGMSIQSNPMQDDWNDGDLLLVGTGRPLVWRLRLVTIRVQRGKMRGRGGMIR